MTTVVFHKDTFYSDSRVTYGSIPSDDGKSSLTRTTAQKVFWTGDSLVGLCGDYTAAKEFVVWLGSDNRKTFYTDGEFNALIYDGANLYEAEFEETTINKWIRIFSEFLDGANFWDTFWRVFVTWPLVTLLLIFSPAFAVGMKKHYRYKGMKLVDSDFAALGSGTRYAKEAWVNGWDAKNCVRYAASKDQGTNYDVKVYSWFDNKETSYHNDMMESNYI